MKKILVVEDEKLLGDMYLQKLNQAGFKTVLINSTEEIIPTIEKENPDLILLDVLLPKETGISFLKSLKDKKITLKIPVLIFSNYDGVDIRKEALALGAKEYLLKTDYTPQEIVNEINKYLDK